MYRLWLERKLPEKYAMMLEGVAVIINSADETLGDPFLALAEADGIIAGSRLDYDASLMNRAPQLRVISRTGIGIDKISVTAATTRGIAVCNAPDAPTISTAEHTLALIFAVAKQLKRNDRAFRTEDQQDFFTANTGLELYGKRLGMIGLGRVGGRVAKLALGLGMSVVGYDPVTSAQQAQTLGVELKSGIDGVLRVADIVSLHVPLLAETRGMINADRLSFMKQGAILINTARSELVDGASLLEALEYGHLAGAGLDVLEPNEYPSDHPLLNRDDVIATPHIASATDVGKDRLWQTAIVQALQVLRRERPANLVNPEVWPLDW